MSTVPSAFGGAEQLSIEDVLRLARLARVRLGNEEAERFRKDLSQIIGYFERLRALPADGVEPLTQPCSICNRLDEDVPGLTLEARTLEAMAPSMWHGYFKVPKVLGEGGGA